MQTVVVVEDMTLTHQTGFVLSKLDDGQTTQKSFWHILSFGSLFKLSQHLEYDGELAGWR